MTTTAKPKILRVGLLTSVLHVEPARAHDVESSFVLRHIFEAPCGTAYGSTAVEPRFFRGPLEGGGDSFEGRVRDDVYFSDGVRLTAAHIADSLNEAAFIATQANVRAVGDRVVFTLKRPNARFDLALTSFDASVVRRAGARLVGTGPYMLAPDSTPTLVRLVRNPHHRHAPAIDEVLFQAYVPDAEGRATALLAALENGTADLSLSLGRQDIETVRNVRKSIQPGISLAALFINCESPRLRDRRVRGALARAIDRYEIAASSYANPLAFVATSLTPRPLGPLDDSLGFDLEEAQALLAEPGVERPDKLDLLLSWAPRPYLSYPQKVARLVVEQIGRLGIRVEVHQPASSREFTETVRSGRHDLTLSGWVADTMDPHDFLESLFSSDRIVRDDNAAVACNMGRLRSPEMDRALEALRRERDSLSQQAIVDVVNQEAPLVPLMYGPAAAVYSFRVRNFKPSPLWYVPIERLDVDS